jgi:tRNA threonylcarbamoyladenosine biosynthesis protein TsaB
LAAQLPYNRRVLILALDTSSPSGSLAVLQDDKVIGTISTCTGEVYSSRMFRHLEFLLGELSLNLKEFDLFAVTAGPGSFTGLRVGLTAVKGWAEVYGKPIAAISGLEAIATQSRSLNSLLVAATDAHRGQLYCGHYRRTEVPGHDGLTLEGEERVTDPEEFVIALERIADGCPFTVVTPVPQLLSQILSDHRALLATRKAEIDEVSPILAPHVGRLGYIRAQRGALLDDALTLAASYVRRTDAELKWKPPSGI